MNTKCDTLPEIKWSVVLVLVVDIGKLTKMSHVALIAPYPVYWPS